MKPILLNGIEATITDMFLGIDSLLQEGQPNRFEMTALPQNQLSALGTQMYATVKYGPSFPVGEGMVLEFQYDQAEKVEKGGFDRTPQKYSESFGFRPPYWSQGIKKMGEHILTIRVYRKYKVAGIIPRVSLIGENFVPYNIVPPAQE